MGPCLDSRVLLANTVEIRTDATFAIAKIVVENERPYASPKRTPTENAPSTGISGTYTAMTTQSVPIHAAPTPISPLNRVANKLKFASEIVFPYLCAIIYA